MVSLMVKITVKNYQNHVGQGGPPNLGNAQNKSSFLCCLLLVIRATTGTEASTRSSTTRARATISTRLKSTQREQPNHFKTTFLKSTTRTTKSFQNNFYLTRSGVTWPCCSPTSDEASMNSS